MSWILLQYMCLLNGEKYQLNARLAVTFNSLKKVSKSV